MESEAATFVKSCQRKRRSFRILFRLGFCLVEEKNPRERDGERESQVRDRLGERDEVLGFCLD